MSKPKLPAMDYQSFKKVMHMREPKSRTYSRKVMRKLHRKYLKNRSKK